MYPVKCFSYTVYIGLLFIYFNKYNFEFRKHEFVRGRYQYAHGAYIGYGPFRSILQSYFLSLNLSFHFIKTKVKLIKLYAIEKCLIINHLYF